MHGNLYNYSLVEYKTAHDNVTIICEHHGHFEQRPANHVAGKQGCPVCAKQKTTSHTRKSLQHYLPKLIELHSDKYDFSNFNYNNYKSKGSVLCSCGNVFEITMEHLLRGQGCNSCATSGFNPNKPCFFYIIKLSDKIIKCGISVDIQDRFSKLKRACSSDKFEPLYCIHFENSVLAKNLEDLIKCNFERTEVDKELISDGFTETYFSDDIGKISEMVCLYSIEHYGKFLSYSEYSQQR